MTTTTNIEKALTILKWNNRYDYDIFDCKANEVGTKTLYNDGTLEILVNHHYGYFEVLGLHLSKKDFEIFTRMVR